jgi:hypothetical protein
VSCSLRPVGHAHRARLEQLTRETGLFREEEVATAVELLDESRVATEDYQSSARSTTISSSIRVLGPHARHRGDERFYWIVPIASARGTELDQSCWAGRAQVDGRRRRLVVVDQPARRLPPTRGFTSRAATESRTIPALRPATSVLFTAI